MRRFLRAFRFDGLPPSDGGRLDKADCIIGASSSYLAGRQVSGIGTRDRCSKCTFPKPDVQSKLRCEAACVFCLTGAR